MSAASQSVYRQVLGHDFQLLAAELQRFHSMQGRVELSGRCTVKGPHSAAGRAMSAMFALPKTTAETPFKFVLEAGAAQETWRRHFPGRSMVSKMRVGAGVLVERFGPVSFHFRLQADQGRLNMLLQSVTLFGIRAPKFMMPIVMAQETGDQGKLHFRVSAHLPLVGLLAEYRGCLDIEHAVAFPIEALA
jgi:hypothetical protein